MTNINPSPILNDFLTKRASAPQQTEIAQTPEKPEGKKKINKALVGVAAATGLAAIAFAGISMLRKGKIPEEVQKTIQSAEEFAQKANNTAEDVKKMGDDIVSTTVEKMKKTFDEVISFIDNGSKNGYRDVVGENGKLLRKFELENGKPKKLIEYGEDGSTIIRKTEIDSLQPSRIEDITGNTDMDFEDGKPSYYREGFEELADGVRKHAKSLVFTEGNPDFYQEGYEKLAGGGSKCAKRINFTEGKPNVYQEGYEQLASGGWKYAKNLVLSEGKPDYYQEGYEKLAGGGSKCAKRIN